MSLGVGRCDMTQLELEDGGEARGGEKWEKEIMEWSTCKLVVKHAVVQTIDEKAVC